MVAMKTIHAVYEKGVFRPLGAVQLPERAEVEFEPRLVGKTPDRDEDLDGIYAILGERFKSGKDDAAARHNEHQP